VRSPAPAAFTRAQIVQQDLAKIGITVDIVPPSPQRDASRRGEPFDIVDSGCWLFGQYWDPSSILDASFDGRVVRPTGNTNVSYFTNARFERKLDAAARLSGRPRYRLYGKIDLDLARSAAPAVAYTTLNAIPVFVSQRIGCVHINPLFGLSFGALCLKRG
jgi:ABC-type transport system substrate-binding protein